MEVFSLLKFWRNAAGEPTAGDIDVRDRAPDADEDDSFFDLVLTGPDIEFNKIKQKNRSIDNDVNKLSKRAGYTTKSTPSPNNNSTNINDSFSIRKILPIESNFKPQSPISLLRSPPKLRVFMLGLKKSTNPDKLESKCSSVTSRSMNTPNSEQSKRFSTRYRVEEFPISSLLCRDNSLRSKMERDTYVDTPSSSPGNEASRKDVGLHKYLKMIKLKASRIRMFEQGSVTAVVPISSPRKVVDERNGSRAVFKSLMKSRWSTTAVGGGAPVVVVRRDDSAVQQQDGIQSAILHCKRSYSSSSSSSSIISQGN